MRLQLNIYKTKRTSGMTWHKWINLIVFIDTNILLGQDLHIDYCIYIEKVHSEASCVSKMFLSSRSTL